MAKDRAKLTKRRALAFGVETTTGVQETLTAANANIDAMEPDIKYNDEGTSREGSSLSERRKVQGGLSGTIDFKCHLSGIGGGVPAQVNLLTCCGFKATGGVLSPLTAADIGNTGTFWLYKDGRLKTLFGVMLDATFKGEAGKPVEIAFSGRGKRTAGAVAGPRDATMITPAYIDVLPPVLRGVTFTIDGVTYRVPGFELALGNTVEMRQSMTDASAYHAAKIPDHARRLMISPEALALSEFDPYDMCENADEIVWEAVIGDTAGNIITFDGPKLQLFQPPEDEDRNNNYHDKLVFQFNQDADAGDDELIITYDTTS